MNAKIGRSGLIVALGMAFAILGSARPASAIPLFANAQGGVSCQMCHTSVPNLNATGRYVLATNFARVLDAHAQMENNKHLPVALEFTLNKSSVPDPTFGNKVMVGVIDLLSAGYLGKDFTYYASVPIVEGSMPAASIDQGWVAYNGLSHGNGSLQVGMFPTPFFAPWVAMNLSLSGYSFAGLAVGNNGVGVGDNRWGASYTQIGSKGLIGNVAYMTNEGPLETAYDSDTDSSVAGAVGQSVVGSLMYMWPETRWSGGIAFEGGTTPLPSGAKDTYSRYGGLVAYTGPRYMLLGVDLQGNDNNPQDISPAVSSQSHAYSLEAIYNVVPEKANLDLRYDNTNDGMGGVNNYYIGDLAVNIQPNVVFTIEDAMTVGGTPVWSYQLLWGGPWWKNH